jgi:hypothetical protein
MNRQAAKRNSAAALFYRAINRSVVAGRRAAPEGVGASGKNPYPALR